MREKQDDPGTDSPTDAAETAIADPSATPESAETTTSTGAVIVKNRTKKPAPAPNPRRALTWVEASQLAAASGPAAPLEAAPAGFSPVSPALLSRRPRRSPFRPGVIFPIFIVLALIAAYAGTTLLWPLSAIEPEATSTPLQPVSADVSAPEWPEVGAAAVSVGGIDGTLASTDNTTSIASITKLVTALLVLDTAPLAVGEQGPEFAFTSNDSSTYWSYLANGESALDVPVGGTLTEYQMLQGMLIGSANNYADRLVATYWPTDAVYAAAANSWLDLHGISGITIVGPSGIDAGNTASPGALIPLANRALADPVIAEIVRTVSVDLPGAGLVTNTNELLADPGVIGLKTGTLDGYNLLAAKEVTVDDITVRLYAATLDQPDYDTRSAVTRGLFDQLESELQPDPSVTAGSLAGRVETVWGESVNLVTDGDATVVLWNGGTAEVVTSLDLADNRTAGETVGTVTVTGPLNSSVVDVELAEDIEGPTPLWRLTHPLELFGLR
nr:D-alanyl-D-alanine carboxypeptidase [Microbacterium halimionae]